MIFASGTCARTAATICAQGEQPPTPGCTPVREWLDAADMARTSAMRTRVQRDAGRDYDGWLIAQPQRAQLPTRILFPHEGDVFVYDPQGGRRQRLAIEIAGRRDGSLSVQLDGRRLTRLGNDYLWPLAPGRHSLDARSPSGGSHVDFVVERDGPRAHVGFTLGAK